MTTTRSSSTNNKSGRRLATKENFFGFWSIVILEYVGRMNRIKSIHYSVCLRGRCVGAEQESWAAASKAQFIFILAQIPLCNWMLNETGQQKVIIFCPCNFFFSLNQTCSFSFVVFSLNITSPRLVRASLLTVDNKAFGQVESEETTIYHHSFFIRNALDSKVLTLSNFWLYFILE